MANPYYRVNRLQLQPTSTMLRVAVYVIACVLPSARCQSAESVRLIQILKEPSDGPFASSFGDSIAIDGRQAIVGASGDEFAYVYELNTSRRWHKTATLFADDGAPGRFGGSVALDGQWALVGAPATNDRTGAAYVFRRDDSGEWGQIARLNARDAAPVNYFGESVSLAGDSAIIGAPLDRNLFGSTYIFQRNDLGNWTQTNQLYITDGRGRASFGHDSVLAGGIAFVGAPTDSYGQFNWPGSVRLFEPDELNRWHEIAKLTPSELESYAAFGSALDASGDTLVIRGSTRDLQQISYRTGLIYVYEPDEDGKWTETAKIRPDDQTLGDQFGSDVAIYDDILLVGAFRKDGSKTDSGAAYVFQRDGSNNWNQIAKLTEWPFERARGFFGTRVAASGEYLFVTGDQMDRVYVYFYGVPEPSSLVLLLVGAYGLANMRRCLISSKADTST